MAAVDFTDKKTLRAYSGNRPKRTTPRARFWLVPGLAVGVVLVIVFSAAAVETGQAASAPSSGPTLARGKTEAEIKAAYGQALNTLARERKRLGEAYRNAPDAAARRKTLSETSAVIFNAVEHGIIPFWYGTDYGFNGATETPGVGKIACGYFVTTVLRDAGLRLDRAGLGQQPAERIIRTLVDESNIRRYSGRTGEEFIQRLRDVPHGFYLLGLENHVGFLSITSEGAFFIHSTLLFPDSVIREPAAGSRAVMKSEYRVLGDLTRDASLLIRWLGGEKIVTRQ